MMKFLEQREFKISFGLAFLVTIGTTVAIDYIEDLIYVFIGLFVLNLFIRTYINIKNIKAKKLLTQIEKDNLILKEDLYNLTERLDNTVIYSSLILTIFLTTTFLLYLWIDNIFSLANYFLFFNIVFSLFTFMKYRIFFNSFNNFIKYYIRYIRFENMCEILIIDLEENIIEEVLDRLQENIIEEVLDRTYINPDNDNLEMYFALETIQSLFRDSEDFLISTLNIKLLILNYEIRLF